MISTKTRMLREKVPADIIKELRAAQKKYGELKKLAVRAGIKYPNFHLIVTNGMATPLDMKKIRRALKMAA